MLRIIRTLKIDILTLFMTLNIISTLCIISLSYILNYSAISNFSKQVAYKIGNVISSRMEGIANTAIDVFDNTSGLIIHSNNISIDNPQLIQYMMNILTLDNDFMSFMYATATGDSITIENLDLTGQTHYFSDPSKPLSAKAQYLFRVINVNKKSISETLYYKDNSFNILATERLPTLSINMESQPWYINTMQNKKITWSDAFLIPSTHQQGISISKAIIDNQGNFIGIVSIALSNISFSTILNVIQKDTLSLPNSGKIYIINDKGHILNESEEELAKSNLNQKNISRAFHYFTENYQHTFFLNAGTGKYIFYINKTPVNFGNNYYFVIAVPFGNALSNLLEAQLVVAATALLILMASIYIINKFAKRLSTPIATLAYEIDKIRKLDFSSNLRIHSYIKEIIKIDFSVANMRTAMRYFTRYVPKEIVKQLLSKGKDIALGGEKKEVTILFSDIEGFTTIAEKIDVESLMSLLAKYFDGLSKIILNNQGTIDKYIGDSIMAFWGAPTELLNHAASACITALRCQVFLTQFNKEQLLAGKSQFITRFGINTGVVIVGNVGTLERMNYTMIGDSVNIASRLERLCKIYHVGIIISESTYKYIAKQFLVRPLDRLAMKGRHNETTIYELVATQDTLPETDATPSQIELCTLFTAAFEAFTASQFDEAKKLFQELIDKFPADVPSQLYLKRLENFHN